MDGFDSGGSLVGPGRSGNKKGVVLSETSTKPYAFSKIELTGEFHDMMRGSQQADLVCCTDDDTLLASSQKMSENLGIIEVKIYRVIRGVPIPFTAGSTEMDNQPVHERSKKAGGHRVSYVSECFPTCLSTHGVMSPS